MKRIITTLVFLIIITGIAFWITQKGSLNNDSGSIKIGVIMPLTGSLAEPGKNILDGINLAVNLYNESSKNVHPIKLIIEDSKSKSKDGVLAINKLINQDKVNVIIGDLSSEIFLACAPIAEKNKVVMISPGASNPNVRNAGDYIFRNYLSDEFEGKIMADYIFSKLSLKKASLIHVNGDYGIGAANAFKKEYERLGGSIVFTDSYSPGTSNFKTMVIKIKESNPDVVYIIGNPSENGYLVKQMKSYGAKYPIVGNLGFENHDFIAVAKGAFDSILFSTAAYDAQSENPVVKKFVYEFEKEYNKTPDMTAGLGYDVVNILLYCFKANSFNVSSLKDDLYKVADFVGVTGVTTFDEYGDVSKDIYIKKILGNGEISFIESYKYKN